MGNSQVGGIALKAGATLTGLGTLATLVIFVARASDDSSVSTFSRGVGPIAGQLGSPPPSTPSDPVVLPLAPSPAASPHPAAVSAPAVAQTSHTSHAPARSVTKPHPVAVANTLAAGNALAVPPSSTPVPNAISAPQPTPSSQPPQKISPTSLPPTAPWTPSPTPSSMLPPWQNHGPGHAHPAKPHEAGPKPNPHPAGDDPTAVAATQEPQPHGHDHRQDAGHAPNTAP